MKDVHIHDYVRRSLAGSLVPKRRLKRRWMFSRRTNSHLAYVREKRIYLVTQRSQITKRFVSRKVVFMLFNYSQVIT